jgi:hypothetical protein
MNQWGDFNDAAPLVDDGGTDIPASGNIEMDRIPAAVDLAAITIFLQVVFGYCDGLVPVRGFVDQGQGLDTKPHNIWIPADGKRRPADRH